jgi:hypothetical protein
MGDQAMDVGRFGRMAEADHHIVSECRNRLCDALKATIKEGYMSTPDWLEALHHTQAALAALSELLHMHIDAETRR